MADTSGGAPGLNFDPVPAGAYQDSQFLADQAALGFDIRNQYNDLQRQLGYTDSSGNFIPGTVATEAARQAAELQRNVGLAAEQTTQEMQRSGTLFSGYRGTAQARAEHPFVQAIADLDTTVPQMLSTLWEKAAGLTQSYSIGQQQLLAAAAQRQLDQLMQQQLIDATNAANNPSGGGGGGDGTTPSGTQVPYGGTGNDTMVPPPPPPNANLPPWQIKAGSDPNAPINTVPQGGF